MDSRRDIKQLVRNFLFSSVNKEFLTFLFFLALSGVFWLMMTLNETYEKEVEIPVRIVNVPKNVVLTSDELDTVKVTLRDKGLMLISYLYGEGMRPLTINFKTYAKGNGYSAIPASELQRLIYQQLSASTKIVGSKPDKLEIFFNYGLSKRVPVKWTGRVIPEHLYFISHVEYFPDSVSIYASQEKLDSIKVIYTEQLPRHTVRHLQATENTRREGRSRQGESGVPYRHSHRRKHQRHTRQGHQHARRQGAAHVPVESDGEVCHRSKPIQKHQGARLRGSCRLCRDNEKPIRQVQHIPEVGAQRHFATVAKHKTS